MDPTYHIDRCFEGFILSGRIEIINFGWVMDGC